MNTRNFLTTASFIGLAAAALAMPATAFGQNAAVDAVDGDEIVVTAQRREEKLVDVPITVATLSAAQLDTANVQQLSDISKITPSLRFDSQAAFVQPTIRGIGTGITTSGGGSNVGIYIDGFYSPNPLAASFQLMKVQNIQVLKGPQGTLFGRNTTGGAILVQTDDPSTETAGEVKVSYGRFNEVRAQAYATTGISERVALDIEGLYRRGDGFITNLTTGRKDGNYHSWLVRLGLKADLSDSTSVLIRYMHDEVDDPTTLLTNSNVDTSVDLTTGLPWGVQTRTVPAGSFTTNPDFYVGGADKRLMRAKTDIIQGTIKSDLGFANLTSYTQYRQEKVDMSEDLDQMGLTIYQLGLPIDNATFSQEILLNSKPGGRLQWTAGLFYFQNRDTYVTFVDNGVSGGFGRTPLGGSSTTTKSFAAFLDGTYEVTPDFFVTAGLRYSHDWITDGYYIQPFSGVRTPVTQAQYNAVKADRLTPRVVLRYKPTDSSSIYASYNRGYKAGILDVGGATGNFIKPETIDAFELGYKYDGGRLSFGLSGFYYNYKNLQVSIFRAATAELVNAAKSEIYGLEGQLRYDVTDNFQVNIGASWTHARYKEFGNIRDKTGRLIGAPLYATCPAPVPLADPTKYAGECGFGQVFYVNTETTLRDVTMQRVPEFTGNIGARYKTDLGGGKLTLSGNLYYTSHFFFSPSGTQFKQDGYEVLSLRAEWVDPSEHFSIALWGDNLTNSRYRTQVQYNNFGIGSTWSPPTTFGVELGAKF